MEPPYDPNWFYSSLAQSAASIVGLMGAILSTRLQSQIERATEQRLVASGALRDLDQAIRPLVAQLSAYVEHSPAQIRELKSAVAQGGGSVTMPLWYSPYDCGRQNVRAEASNHTLAVENARTSLAQAVLPTLRAVLEAKSPEPLIQLAPTLEPLLRDDAEGMPAQLRSVAARSTSASVELQTLQVRADPTTAVVLSVSLAILAVAGLIVPLTFLSAYSSTHRVLLTSFFGIGLLVLLIYLFIQTYRLGQLARFRTLLPPSDERPAV